MFGFAPTLFVGLLPDASYSGRIGSVRYCGRCPVTLTERRGRARWGREGNDSSKPATEVTNAKFYKKEKTSVTESKIVGRGKGTHGGGVILHIDCAYLSDPVL